MAGNVYYRLTPENGVDDVYPLSLPLSWPGLPDTVDAAFQYLNGKTYFFAGPNYYRYDDEADEVNAMITSKTFLRLNFLKSSQNIHIIDWVFFLFFF